jgi:hypothetical protein
MSCGAVYIYFRHACISYSITTTQKLPVCGSSAISAPELQYRSSEVAANKVAQILTPQACIPDMPH